MGLATLDVLLQQAGFGVISRRSTPLASYYRELWRTFGAKVRYVNPRFRFVFIEDGTVNGVAYVDVAHSYVGLTMGCVSMLGVLFRTSLQSSRLMAHLPGGVGGKRIAFDIQTAFRACVLGGDEAGVCNVRYQLLLTCLLHTYDYPSNLDERSQRSPRGLLVHAAFGEMYNLRAISGVLMQTPLLKNGDAHLVAGPPFQMPYTLLAPVDAPSRWRAHQDLLKATAGLADLLLGVVPETHHRYLHSLKKIDANTSAAIDAILGYHPLPEVT